MKHNWKNIGPVTLKGPRVVTTTFKDLVAFVKSNYYFRYRSLLTDNFSRIVSSWKTMEARVSFYETDCYSRFDSHSFFSDHCYLTDELGLIVPLWKIEEVANQWCEKKVRHRSYWFRRSHWNGWRRPGTLNELRAEAGFEQDEDIREFKVKYRRRDLPTTWDDMYRSDHRDRSWKRNRRTQYKGVDIN